MVDLDIKHFVTDRQCSAMMFHYQSFEDQANYVLDAD